MESAPTPARSRKPVLLAEDSADDALLMKRALTAAGVCCPLIHAWNGEEAIELLRKQSGSELPELVVLDIKMPRCDGFEVLQWIKSTPELMNLPVVMLSSSAMAADREKAAKFGANYYYVKPATLSGLVELARSLRERWLEH